LVALGHPGIWSQTADDLTSFQLLQWQLGLVGSNEVIRLSRELDGWFNRVMRNHQASVAEGADAPDPQLGYQLCKQLQQQLKTDLVDAEFVGAALASADRRR
jgi:hypothetical protein